jgi:hypothetical protein
MSGSNGMDSMLECVVLGVRRFLLLHSIVIDATRGLKWAMFIRNREAPGMQRLRSPSRVSG